MERVTPFFAFPEEVEGRLHDERGESLHMSLRKIIKTPRSFPVKSRRSSCFI